MGEIIKTLNSGWQIKKDPQEKGLKEKWYSKTSFGGKKFEVNLPWQSYSSELREYTGTIWYQKKFDFDFSVKENENYIVEFEAVDYRADVWLNSVYLGSNEGGYTPFTFNLNQSLKKGENNLIVKVFDPEDNQEIPRGKQGSWYTRVSGIWQGVKLKKYQHNYIKNLYFTPDLDKSQVEFETELFKEKIKENDRSELKLRLELFSAENPDQKIKEVEFDYQKDKVYSFKLKDPKLWTPENPNIYEVNLFLVDNTAEIDKYSSYFGMRKVERKNGKIYLNNKPLYLRGALDQAFWPKTIYRAETEEMIIDEIKKAKAMGFNLLRKHIKAEDPRYLEMADRMGILIWAEAANYAKWNLQARDRFKKEYTKMVKRDYNHPSIIIWSIYNEEWGLEWDLNNDKEKQKWVEEFYDYARELDSSRLICDNSGWAHVKTDLNDYHRYFAVPEDYKEWSADLDKLTAEPDKNFVKSYQSNNEPIIMSEFGMWSLAEYGKLETGYGGEPPWFDSETVLFSEDFKKPSTSKINFKKYKLDQIFDDFDQLAAETKLRELEGVKYQIEEMRKRKDIAGYVVTELTDIEWETNGFLDYFRDYKFDLEAVQSFNSEIIISLDLNKRNISENENLIITPTVVNNSQQNLKTKAVIKIASIDYKNEIEVEIAAGEIKKLKKLEIEIPELKKSIKAEIKAYLKSDQKIAAQNKETISLNKKVSNLNSKRKINFKNKASSQIAKFKNLKADQNAEIWLSDKLDKEVLAHLWQGGKVLFLAAEGDKIKEKDLINFKKLESGESWDKAASSHFVNNKILAIPLLNKISRWELVELYPDYTIRNLNDLNWENIISGYFKGWIGDFGATTAELNYGKGKLLVTTLKLEENLENQPLAETILNHLIDYLAGGDN